MNIGERDDCICGHGPYLIDLLHALHAIHPVQRVGCSSEGVQACSISEESQNGAILQSEIGLKKYRRTCRDHNVLFVHAPAGRPVKS